jgi:hypothetical protein
MYCYRFPFFGSNGFFKFPFVYVFLNILVCSICTFAVCLKINTHTTLSKNIYIYIYTCICTLHPQPYDVMARSDENCNCFIL